MSDETQSGAPAGTAAPASETDAEKFTRTAATTCATCGESMAFVGATWVGALGDEHPYHAGCAPIDANAQVQIPLTAMREERDAARAEAERLKQRVSAAEAEVKRLNKGLDLYRAKMAADGLNGRDWSARRHYDAWQGVLQWEQSSPRHRVVSALIIEPGPDQQKPLILLAQRKWNQSYPGQWESPGGKVESGETDEEALIREVREELGCACKVVHGVASVDLDPPKVLRSLTLTFYRVVLLGKPEPLASDGLRYVSAEEMQQMDLMPANRVLIAHVLAEMALRPGLGR